MSAPISSKNIQTLPDVIQIMVAKFSSRESIAKNATVSKEFKKIMDHPVLWNQMAAQLKFKLDPIDPKKDFIKQYISAVNQIFLKAMQIEFAKPIREILDPFAQREALEKHISSNPKDFNLNQLASRLASFMEKPTNKSALMLLLKHGIWIADADFAKALKDPDVHPLFEKWLETVKQRKVTAATNVWNWAISQPDPTNYVKALTDAGTIPMIPNLSNGIMRVVFAKTPEERAKMESIFAQIKDAPLLAHIQETIKGADVYVTPLMQAKPNSEAETKIRAEAFKIIEKAIKRYFTKYLDVQPTTSL